MPGEGMDRRTYRSAKFGSWEYSLTLDHKTVLASREDAVVFDYDRIARTPNTRRAHRLMVLAAREGRDGALSEALFRGYFEQGRDIGDPEVLVAVAADVGIDAERAREFVAENGEGLGEVLQAEAEIRTAGVASVPLVQIGGCLIPGAQPVSTFMDALQTTLGRQIAPAA